MKHPAKLFQLVVAKMGLQLRQSGGGEEKVEGGSVPKSMTSSLG